MIVYEKDGKDYLLLANSSRGVMKISTEQIDEAESIVAPVPDGGKKGLPYETIESWTGVEQLDRLDASTSSCCAAAKAARSISNRCLCRDDDAKTIARDSMDKGTTLSKAVLYR